MFFFLFLFDWYVLTIMAKVLYSYLQQFTLTALNRPAVAWPERKPGIPKLFPVRAT